MNKVAKMTIIALSIFVLGMTMAAIASHPVEAKTFADKGYKWEIKDFDWKQMKKSAKSEYAHAVDQGRAIPIGYSYAKNVTVSKGGTEYDGIAFAIKNEGSIRCEVRGVLSEGERLEDYETTE